MNGCKEGNCQLLFNENARCDHRKKGKLFVCDMMNQEDGRCRCVAANGKNKHRVASPNDSFFRKRSDQHFAIFVEKKKWGYTPDLLPYRSAK
jgi:hypothetical protein